MKPYLEEPIPENDITTKLFGTAGIGWNKEIFKYFVIQEPYNKIPDVTICPIWKECLVLW